MANITQHIPSYTGGISEQPDELKIPGQVNKAKNVLPDVVQGLLKRPGGKLVGQNITASTGDSKWFHYYRDENEQYIGQIKGSDGVIKMWRCNAMTIDGVSYAAGSPVNVVYDTLTETAVKSYLQHTTDEDLQTLTLNDFTYITNRNKTVAMSTDKSPVKPSEAFIELKKIAYANQYAVNLFDTTATTTETTATRINVTKTDDDETDICPHVDTKILNINAFATATGLIAFDGSFDSETWSTSDGVYSNVTYTIDNTGTDPVLKKNAVYKLTLNRLAAHNNDHSEDVQETNNTHSSGHNEDYFLRDSQTAEHIESDTNYYKLKNLTTGQQLISAAVTGTTTAQVGIYADVVTALKAGTAITDGLYRAQGSHTSGAQYTSGDQIIEGNYVYTALITSGGTDTAGQENASSTAPTGTTLGGTEAGGTNFTWKCEGPKPITGHSGDFSNQEHEGKSSSYDQLPFTISDPVIDTETNKAVINLQYKNADTPVGEWVLLRCNRPSEVIGDSTHQDSDSDPVWEQKGRERPYQARVDDNADGTWNGIKTTEVNAASTVTTTGYKKDLYFRITTTGQSVATGEPSAITYKCRYTTTYDLLHGGSGWSDGDNFTVTLKEPSTEVDSEGALIDTWTKSIYTVNIEKSSTAKIQGNLGVIRPTPTSFDTKTTVTAESILGNLQTEIIAADPAWTAWPDSETASSTGVKIIGNGLYIRRSDNTNPFNISTPNGELLNVLSDEVKDIADLPEQCRHGYIVKVANSEDDEDDYYVKFIGQEKADGTFLDGKGIWEECVAPDQEYKYDPATMPVTLIRTKDGNFRVAQLDGVKYYLSQDILDVDATCELTGTNEITVKLDNHGYSVGDSVGLSEDVGEGGDFFSGPLPSATYIVTKVESADKFSVESSNITGTSATYIQEPSSGSQESYKITLSDHGLTSINYDYNLKFTSSSGTLPASGNYDLWGLGNANHIHVLGNIDGSAIADTNVTGNVLLINKKIKVAPCNYEHPKWEDALVGVTVEDGTGTNPRASFVGKTINSMLFFRNRLVMLSDENVIMSQPGDFFNFWAKSAITYGNTDMIDISCSSEYPAIVYDGIQVNSGLVLFTKNQQFMLTTDSDLLNPLTAKINSLSAYNFNFKTNPFSLGTTIGFLDNAGKYNRFWEMTAVLREGDPNVIEQSKTISKSFPNDIDMVANSRENQVVFFGKKGTSTVYGFRYHTDAAARIQQAWFEWELRGTIQHIAVLDDALYVVLKNQEDSDDNYHIEKYEIKADDPFVIIDTDFNVYLDKSVKITANNNEVNSNISSIEGNDVESYYNSATDLVAYQINGNKLGQRYTSTLDTNNHIQLNGTPNGDIILGYEFETEVELPKIYLQQKAGNSFRSDIQSSLTLQRLKLNFGDFGTCTTTLNREVKGALTTTHTAKPITSSVAAAPFIQSEETLTIPVYEKNKNVTITIKSKHPSPSTLHSMNWEGDYTDKYYKRV